MIRKKIILSLIVCFYCFAIQAQKTAIKGKVHNWVSDTVYVTNLSFHSAESSWVKQTTITKDSTFSFNWENENTPLVIAISPLKSFTEDLQKNLIYENLTDQYYMSYCLKFYNNISSMFILQPGKTLYIDLTANTWIDELTDKQAEYYRNLGVKIGEDNRVRDYGATQIKFKGDSDNFSNNYYKKLPLKLNEIEEKLDSYSSKNLNLAIANLNKVQESLLQDLEKNRDKLEPLFYDYIKTEIIFGSKKGFLKYLLLDKTDYLKKMVESDDVPIEIANIITFDKFSLNETSIKSEMYNEYLEFYINFVQNNVEGEYKKYHDFDLHKIRIIMSELPLKSSYYYISNRILNQKYKEDFKDIYKAMIHNFPNGELNDSLKEKFENK